MVHRNQKIIYKSFLITLLLTCFSVANSVNAESEAKKKERMALEKSIDADEGKENKSTPLITLESIAAKSGDLLGIPKKEQTLDSIALAMASAYKTNSEIQTQRSSLRAADESVAQARAGWRPTVKAQLSTGVKRNRTFGNAANNSSSSGGTDSAQVSVSQNIFNGGATVAATESAKATVKAERAALLDKEQNILLSAVKAYLDLIGKLAQIEVLRANENFLKTTFESVNNKKNVGEETKTSVAQAEGQYALAVVSRQKAEAELEGLKATYKKVVGRLAGKLAKPTLPRHLPKTVEEALEKARLNNPSILQKQYLEIAARRKVDQINGALLPSVTVQAQSTVSNAEKTTSQSLLGSSTGKTKSVDHQAIFSIDVPLYDAGSNRSQKRQAIEMAEQNREQIETTRRAVEQQLIQDFATLKTSMSNQKYYEKQVQANEISVQGTWEEVSAGTKILLNLLDEQKKLLDAQLALVEDEQNRYFAAYEIMALTGELTAETMQLDVEYYDHKAHYNEVKYAF